MLRTTAILALLILSSSAPGFLLAAPGPGETEVHRVELEGGLRLALHRFPTPARTGGPTRPAVLILHGSTFPTRLSSAYRFADGSSWMGQLAAAGWDVWGLDFLGYGQSDRYPQMLTEIREGHPLGRAEEAAAQVLAAVRYIEAQEVPRLSLIAHSWGTVVAGRFVEEHGDRVDRLVLFGAIAQRSGDPSPLPAEASAEVTGQQQLDRFRGQVPPGEPMVLEEPELATWAPAYLATDPRSGERQPPAVRVPNGPSADVAEAWSGHLPYDPSRIRVPTLLIRGEWDPVTTAADTEWLFSALTAVPEKRSVVIGRGTHLLQLEKGRLQL
ncbi:MAG: alpha/beta fold hydrolase, partial [Acidobacteria bacterium]|nr:alpha/beta fold hydrolase [Acidobacteriota bacterium]